MLGLLGTKLVELGSNWILGKQEIKKAEQQQKVAEIEQKTILLRDKQSNNHAWELAVLSADRLAFLRTCSFWLFTAPVLYTVYDPERASQVWSALATVPEWVIGVQLAITGFIWAAKPLANMGAGMVSKRQVP